MIRGSISLLCALFLAGCSSSDSTDKSGGDAGSGGATSGGGGAKSSSGGAPNGGGSGGASKGSGGSVGKLNPLEPSQIPPPDPNAEIIPNIDSAIINIDPVDGAKDYRAFVIEDGVEVLTDAEGHEVVNGATIFCAGQRQRARPKLPVPEVMTKIEVTDLKGPKTYVVEAIDTLCPYAGFVGHTATTVDVTSSDARTAVPHLVVPFPVVTEQQVREKYGSMIINGHRPSTQNGFPADPVVPRVLKRWQVQVAPLDAAAAAARRTKDFFSDFSNNDDQPKWIEGGTNGDGTFHAPPDYGYSIAAYQNSEFVFYSTNTELAAKNHVRLDRGQLHMFLPDLSQGVMGTVMAIPKKAAHVADDTYLHVTFENSTISTPRRYWWLTVCGPDSGPAFKSNGELSEWIVLGSGFFNNDGRNPSTKGWNCLIVFPHDGIGTSVPQGSSAPNPESSVIVMIHKSGSPTLQTAVDVSPQQLNEGYPRAWYRTQKGGAPSDRGILDDVLWTAPRVRFDMYISRSRLVMYVNGEQRICNNFGPERLTMGEAAIGFNDALYHSSAEHTELQTDFADRTGQLFLIGNEPFADHHTYDNVGFEEGVGLPASYSDADCYTHAP